MNFLIKYHLALKPSLFFPSVKLSKQPWTPFHLFVLLFYTFYKISNGTFIQCSEFAWTFWYFHRRSISVCMFFNVESINRIFQVLAPFAWRYILGLLLNCTKIQHSQKWVIHIWRPLWGGGCGAGVKQKRDVIGRRGVGGSEYSGSPIFIFFIKENEIRAMTRQHAESNMILLTRNLSIEDNWRQ